MFFVDLRGHFFRQTPPFGVHVGRAETSVFERGIKPHFAQQLRARFGKRFVTEGVAVGGAFGEWITMLTIRHKTRHLKFMLLLLLFITAHVLLLGWVIIRFAL